MYAVINNYDETAPADSVCGRVVSLHLHRSNADSAAARLLTLARVVPTCKNNIAIARIFNGRHKGDSVLKTDIVVLAKFATGLEES